MNKNKLEGRGWRGEELCRYGETLLKVWPGGQRERFNYAMTILALHSKAQKENQQPRKNKIGERYMCVYIYIYIYI